MAVSLAAGAILGIVGAELAQIFAWIGVGFVVYIFAKTIGKADGMVSAKKVEVSGEEIAEIYNEIKKGKDVDN